MPINFRLTTAFVALFFSTLLVTPKSYNYAPLCLAVMGLLLIVKTFKNLKRTPIKYVSLILMAYPVLTGFSLLFLGGNINQLDMPSRTLLVAPIIALLLTYPPKTSVVYFSIPTGAIIVGIIASIQVFVLKQPRALSYNGYMSIQAGGIAANLSVLSLITSFYYLNKKQKGFALYAILGFLISAFACLSSGARGAWILTPFIIVAIFWLQCSLLSKKMMTGLLISFCLLGILAFPQLKMRVNSMRYDIAAYEKNNPNTSSGARLEMWKSAALLGLEKPLFGQGYAELMTKKQEQVKNGIVDKIILRYTRAHNQYLEEFQVKGFVGVTVLLAFFLIPFYYFIQQYRKTDINSEQHYFSLMGLCHIALIMGYCLTQHYLAHNSGIILYTTGVAIFMALSFSEQRAPQLIIDKA